MIQIERLEREYLNEAATLFASDFARLRQAVPVLPPALESQLAVAGRLSKMEGRSLMALEDGQLTGFLAWWVVDRFRGSPRRGAYVPEWGHGALLEHKTRAYRTLYRAAATEWTETGCGVHAITLLANDDEAREAWFWNGFGLAVVDAARSTAALDDTLGSSFRVRHATAADAEMLSALDAEHVRHYTAAPVFMAPPHADTPEFIAEFIARPKNSVWLVLDGTAPAGFMRFTGYDFDAVAALESNSAAFCNGAYVRGAHRGQGAGRAMLQAALKHYAALGLDALYTNFEAFNPEAAGFWPRYFRPVCLSLMRVPEVLPVVSIPDRTGL